MCGVEYEGKSKSEKNGRKNYSSDTMFLLPEEYIYFILLCWTESHADKKFVMTIKVCKKHIEMYSVTLSQVVHRQKYPFTN